MIQNYRSGVSTPSSLLELGSLTRLRRGNLLGSVGAKQVAFNDGCYCYCMMVRFCGQRVIPVYHR